MKRPLILVTNDDGHRAKGLQKLIEIAREFGDVVVMSAAESQSGQSQAITIKSPLQFKLAEESEGFLKYVVKGTPADGVKLALCNLLDRMPDLLLSGINHGTNTSSSVVYSGTMGAAIEGALHEIPSIGFSLLDYRMDADFDASDQYVRSIVANVVKEGLPDRVCLNVNIPAVPRDQIKGVKVCRQTNGYWHEHFEIRKDPRGLNYSWITGSFVDREPEAEDTDEGVLKQGYISVVPIHTDFTAYHVMSKLRTFETNEIANED